MVVVIPNYRLGVLGFLYDGTERGPGNAGLHDQRLAFDWTRTNIGSFGGNASQLVGMGYGAGAASLGYHLFSEALLNHGNDTPWLSRVILMSGSPFTRSQWAV